MFQAPHTILPPEPARGTVLLAPAYNVLTTMTLINQMEETTDFHRWIVETVASLDEKTLERQHLLFWGLGMESIANAVDLDVSHHDFPRYLQALQESNPVQLRDNIWYSMRHSSHARLLMGAAWQALPPDLLRSKSSFTSFFSGEMEKVATGTKQLPQAIFEDAYELLTHPDALQELLLNHLSHMWQTGVAAEWQRVEPLLQDTVDACQRIRLDNLPVFDMIQTVTRRDVRPIFHEETLRTFRQIQFIPSIHNGPYIMWSGKGDTLRLTFSAYIPQGIASRSAAQLSQGELVNRLKALADDNRVKILDALGQAGEMSTQELIEELQLSKSAASRHLRLLRANRFIEERRSDDGVKKFYRLSPESAGETVGALTQLLGTAPSMSDSPGR